MLCVVGQTFFKRLSVGETPPREHGAAPVWVGRERYRAFSSPIKANDRAVTGVNVWGTFKVQAL
jgi:hypothetical protein